MKENYKRVINGREYNPATARYIVEHLSNPQDANAWELETLYRKRNGEYFLHVQGGSTSQYRKYIAREGRYVEGENIKPLSTDAASTWAATYLSPHDHRQLFGRLAGDKIRITAYISAQTREELLRMAAEKRCSVSEVLDLIITQASAEHYMI